MKRFCKKETVDPVLNTKWMPLIAGAAIGIGVGLAGIDSEITLGIHLLIFALILYLISASLKNKPFPRWRWLATRFVDGAMAYWLIALFIQKTPTLHFLPSLEGVALAICHLYLILRIQSRSNPMNREAWIDVVGGAVSGWFIVYGMVYVFTAS